MNESNKLVIQFICRMAGALFLCFFLNAIPQITELIGPNGLAPSPFPLSNAVLYIMCAGGIALSVALIAGKTSPFIIFLLWALLAFIAKNSSLYFFYLWETLLLEFSFCLIWVRLFASHGNIGIWILRFLLFRLMFMMGYVKITSTSEHWKSLMYLKYYFQNQPMPYAVSWFLFQLPDVFHKAMSALTLFLEVFVPFLIFSFGKIRRIRYYIFWIYTAFFLSIFITGNYSNFHLISIVLSLSLLSDDDLSARIKHWLTKYPFSFMRPRKITLGLTIALTTAYIFLTFFWCIQLMVRPPQLAFIDATWLKTEKYPAIPDFAQAGLRVMNNHQMSFPYDLFSHVTLSRYEMVLEGSNDGHTWLRYRFLSKTSAPDEIAGMYAPYQHRMDHHLFYYAAFQLSQDENPNAHRGTFKRTLNNAKSNLLLERLLEGSPEAKGLLRFVPFPDKPPKMVRLSIYRASFTDWKTRWETGNWWNYEFVREFERRERKN